MPDCCCAMPFAIEEAPIRRHPIYGMDL